MEVNTTLFHVMHTLKVSPDSDVSLFLEQDGRKMVFGIEVDRDTVFDLWHYMMADLPNGILL